MSKPEPADVVIDQNFACTVLDLLPASQRGAFTKEDGEAVIDAAGNRI